MQRLGLGIVACLAIGCAEPAGTWVAHGEVASVGIVRDGPSAQAYVCGATADGLEDWTRWFTPDAWDASRLEVQEDGWTLTVEADGDNLVVDVSGPADEALTWTATPQSESEGGLFFHEGACRDGAIVGSGKITGAWCDIDTEFFQVEPVDTLIPDDSGSISLQPIGVEAAPFPVLRVIP